MRELIGARVERIYTEEEIARAVVVVIRSSTGGELILHDLKSPPWKRDLIQIVIWDEALEFLDEAEMNRAGWYRRDRQG